MQKALIPIRTLTFGSSQTVDMCVLIIPMLYQSYKYQRDATLMLPGFLSE